MSDLSFLSELQAIIEERRTKSKPEDSYVAKLSAQGMPKVAQKVGEEAVETVIAAMQGDKAGLVYESADLLFHLMVLWSNAGVSLDDIAKELHGRQCKVKK